MDETANNQDKKKASPTKNPTIEITKEQALNELWNDGVLFWKLHKTQLEIYKKVIENDSQKFIINCSRRLGKSYLLCIIALEYAIKNPGCRICYATFTQKAVSEIVEPIITEICKDAPDWLKPRYKVKDRKYEFPNGSIISLAGTDAERAETLRGQSMHLGIVDEAGFMANLKYVVSDILMPQTLTTGGRIIIASTPPKTPAHDFKEYAMDAEIAGNYVKKTIYDNPLVTTDTIVRFMMDCEPTLTKEEAVKFAKERSGPPKNTTWWREYMAEFLTDEESAIVPEFNDEKIKEIVIETERPPFYDAYVVMDVGFKDFTAVLFGYFDFLKAAIVIEDEVIMSRMTTEDLATQIKKKERELWNEKTPYQRYSDIDLILMNDLIELHGLTFLPVEKYDLHASVNNLRIMIANNKIIINPRCKQLIAHIKGGVWDKNKVKFKRMEGYGHFDALAALMYFARSVDTFKNPVPPRHGLSPSDQFIRPDYGRKTVEDEIKKIFNPKKFLNDD